MQKIILKIKNLIQSNEKLNYVFICSSLFLVLFAFSPLINLLFEIKPQVSNFNQHQISNASLYNLDVGKRVSLFYKLLMAVLFATFLLFLTLKIYFKNQILEKNQITSSIYSTSALGVLAVFSGFLMYTTDIAVAFIVIILFYFFIELKQNNNNHQKIISLWSVFMAIPFALFVYTLIKNANFLNKIPLEFKLKGYLIPIDLQSFLFTVFLFLISLFFFLIQKKLLKKQTANQIFTYSIPVILTPFVTSIALEITNVLNIRFNLIFNQPFLLFLIVILFGFLVSTVLYKRKKQLKNTNGAKYFLLFSVLSLVVLIAQPWRIMMPDREFFEAANHGIAIDHFFKYGSIPFIENFDAHLFNQQFFSYIYVFLNGYEPWSHSLYIMYFYALEIIVMYLVFKKVFGSINSLILVLCVPILPIIQNEFALAGLLLLYLPKTINKPTLKNYFIFWIVAILLCMYKLDVGYGALLAGLILLLFFNKLQHNKYYIKNIAISGAFVGGVLLFLFVFLCLVKSINPITRLQEFLLAAMSDQNWGIAKMGDQTHFLFRFSYYIFPLVVTIYAAIVFINLTLKKEIYQRTLKNKNTQFIAYGFLFYFLFFIFNAQRGIVFHNFEYGNIIRITSTIPLALLFLSLLYDKKRKLIMFSFVFLGLFLFLNTSNVNFKNKSYSLLQKSVNSGSFHEKFLDATAFNGTRLKTPFDLEEITFFEKFLNKVLLPTETYYDFSSNNLLHALTNRKNPGYINQSPLMLNGDKAQDFELEHIKNNNIKIVLMPIKNVVWHAISEVYVDFKYYKLAEYFYANYTPLFRTSMFDVYVKKENLSTFNQKLKSLGQLSTNSKVTNFTFLNDISINKNNILISSSDQGKTNIKSTGSSSFFIGIMDYLRKNRKINNENLPTKMVFKTKANATGNIKIYYNIYNNETFNEARTKEFNITEIGEKTIEIDFLKMPHELMIALNTDNIDLESIEFLSDAQSNINTPDKIDYFIGFIPYLWGEKSENPIFDKIKPLTENTEESNLTLNVLNLNKNKSGAFVYAEIDAQNDLNATIEITENDIAKASLTFSIVKGKHKYAIRVSNNYYWWNSKNPKIVLKAQNAVKFSKCALVTTDGSQIKEYKSTGLTISNLTDNNWNKGCGTSLNMILLDYSPTKENLLKKYKKIKLINGSFVTISSFYVSGNYINVTLNEKVTTFANQLAYPNPIELVN